MIIVISGKIGSGKDEVGRLIQYVSTTIIPDSQEYSIRHKEKGENVENPRFEIVKFADKVKNIVCLLLGCTRDDLEDKEFINKELVKSGLR